ncbi:hypothetical protein KX729_03440 [Rhizobium sp. XQZ8]|uniref:hypothetical protein n=1 Tax=Rhizobium populisoli TaxID=2859785 RepID=UPI001CA5624F|nr:hypothetical protein [Rhizobium populisoli]MBW6420482.1 hypothetical protein [Rhizobium populisoli]
MIYSTKARLLAAGAALSLFAGPALALDGNDVVAKLNKALSIQGGAGLSAESVTTNGSDVTLNKAKFTAPDGKQSLQLGTIKMLGIEEDSGSYYVDKVSFDNVNVTEEKMTFVASDMSISGLSIPADANGNDMDSVLLYEGAHVGKISATLDGKPAFSIDSSDATLEVADDNSSIDFDVKMNGIKGDLTLVDEPEAKDTIQQLGLTSIDGKVSMQGSWELKDGTLDIEEYAFDFAKVGKLNIALSISGYTLDFIKSLNETTKTMAADPNNQEAQQAAGLAMLGLMQRLTFNSAEIRFDDAGITKKGLEYAAKKQNTTADQLTQMLKGMTPMMLAQLNVPELQNMVATAVNTYLDKPGSMTISAEPKEGVPFPMIMGAAMGAPNTLPTVLGVTVKANN